MLLYVLFIILMISLGTAIIVCVAYEFRKAKKNVNNNPKTLDLYALDMQKWRGGVRHRMGLEKTMEQFRQEANQIKYP